jgi:hypothetical protein
VKGDALEVVLALGCEVNCGGRYGHLVEDANTLLNQSSKWRVNHVRREANQAAHRLARFEEVQLWRSNYPECIREIVLQEKVSC